MSNSQILYNFNELNDKEKLIYSSGFKTAYLMNKNNIKTSSNKINEILNYKISNDVSDEKGKIPLEKEIISKNNNILKNKNKELLNKFEEIIKICPENFKDELVSSLKQYLFYDKKYNEALELFKKVRRNIKENKNNDIWVNQMKYIKIINSYKNMLEKSHDKLYKNISNIKLTNTINPFILKKDNQSVKVNKDSNETVQEESIKQTQEELTETTQKESVEKVKKEKKIRKPRKKKEEPTDQVQEEPTEQVKKNQLNKFKKNQLNKFKKNQLNKFKEPTEQVQEDL